VQSCCTCSQHRDTWILPQWQCQVLVYRPHVIGRRRRWRQTDDVTSVCPVTRFIDRVIYSWSYHKSMVIFVNGFIITHHHLCTAVQWQAVHGLRLSAGGKFWGEEVFQGGLSSEGMSGEMFRSPRRINSLLAVVMLCATLVNTHTHTDSCWPSIIQPS